MPEPIRIFIGSDQRMRLRGAEAVLEHSIRTHTDAELEIVWMRAGDSGWTVGHREYLAERDPEWDIGRPAEQPYTAGWATDFTCFRFAIPALCDFHGRAIYMDADMLVLGDVRELWEIGDQQPWAWNSVTYKRTDVSVLDCAQFADADVQEQWPTIQEMQSAYYPIRHYLAILRANNWIGLTVPGDWDCLDGRHPPYAQGRTKLVHYTNMRTQPWFPYPDVFPYDKPHPVPDVEQLWHRWHKKAKAALS